MTIIYWLTSLAALVGVILNIHGRVAAFYVWMCTNLVWVYADFQCGLYPQAALMSVYFLLSIYGIWKWTRRQKGASGVEEDSH